MPYYKSLARKEFEKNIFLFIKICRSSNSEKIGLSDHAINAIFHAAIFKASALLEEYLKNIIIDWLFLAQKNSCLSHELPENLRWFLFSNSQIEIFKNFLYDKDEKKLIDEIKKRRIDIEIIQDDNNIHFNPKIVVEDRKYPSIKNMKALFNRIGMQDVFETINRKNRKDFKFLIQSFLDIRVAIAHQSPPDLTYQDIKMHLTHLIEFVKVLDRIFFSHILSHNGPSCWRTSQ